MSAAPILQLISIDDYLAGELVSPVFRHTEQGFVGETYAGQDAVIPLGKIETELPLAEIYDGVEFTPEPVEDQNP